MSALKYKTVLADPPWNERGAGEIHRGADRHYPLMKTPEIIEYMSKIPYDDNCHLYLWVTNNFLEHGLEVMRRLGFVYKTNIAWVKDRFGLGQYFRGQHEICLFGVRGNLPYKHQTDPSRSCCTESTVIRARRTEHSVKPEEIFSKVESTSYPPFLEVFARQRRPGWDAIGNEVENTTQLKVDI
jgi:N6-adenosine-specific RNA methylase IME4